MSVSNIIFIYIRFSKHKTCLNGFPVNKIYFYVHVKNYWLKFEIMEIRAFMAAWTMNQVKDLTMWHFITKIDI